MSIKTYLTLILGSLLLSTCISPKEDYQLVLISKEYTGNISAWLKNIDDKIETKMAYGLSADSLDHLLDQADAIIIGGGEDVNPIRYNKPEYSEDCGKFDDYRDSLEIIMIKYAHENKIPILGICRGQQIMNVAHGGTLVPDIPRYLASEVEHRSKMDSAHYIYPTSNSWINNYFSNSSYWVNSRHHQCVDELAANFVVAAYGADSIIESIYIADTSIHPFTYAVQFHPENLRDSLSTQIAKMFIDAIE